jgi:hypothetical protein
MDEPLFSRYDGAARGGSLRIDLIVPRRARTDQGYLGFRMSPVSTGIEQPLTFFNAPQENRVPSLSQTA